MSQSEDLWEKAAEALSEDDKHSFDFSRADRSAILLDILATAETKRQVCMQKRWKFKTRKGESIILRDVCEKMIKWVRKFKEVGDVAVSYDPAHAALPWAAVRVILQISINDVQTFGAMAEGLERVSRSITGCSIIEQLYLQERSAAKKSLQDSLVRLYAAILGYLASAIKYYGRGTLGRLGKSVVQTSETLCEERLRQIADGQSKVEYWRQLIDSERQQRALVSSFEIQASVDNLRNNMQDLMIGGKSEQYAASQRLEAILSSLHQPIQRMSDSLTAFNDKLAQNDRLEILRWLSTVPYRQHHKASIGGVLESSGKWLYRNLCFDEWQSSSYSSLLWLHGIPGSGKSKLLSIVIEGLLKEKLDNPAPLAYFYCARDPSEPQRADPDEVLRAIVKQLSCSDSSRSIAEPILREYQTRKRDAEEDGLEPSKPSTQECTDIILALVDHGPAILIIDALDECDSTKRWQLLNSLFTIMEKSSNVVKILVSSRNDADLVAQMKGFPEININSNDNSDDIQRFIRVEVERAVRDRRILSGRVSRHLQDLIISRLSAGADGMFRWASLQIQNLCDPQRMKIVKDVEAALDRLPITLSELYALIFDQISRTEPRGREIAENVLKWLLCSQRSLSTREMLEFACPRSEGAATIELDMADILSLCCNLVIQDTELDTFRFAHVSVREYLEMRADFEASSLHTLALERCLQVCAIDSYPPVTSSETLSEDIRTVWQYAIIYWIVHYQQIELSTRRREILHNIRFIFVQGQAISQYFSHWINAVKSCVYGTLDPYDPLHGIYTNALDAMVSPLFTVCAFGLLDILEELETIPDLDWNQKGHNGATALYTAACYGFTDMVEILIQKGLNLDTQTDYGETALHRAAEYGHALTVDLLLRKGAHVGISDDQGWTALDFAMRRKDRAGISILIKSGARDEAQAKYGDRIARLGEGPRYSTAAFCTLLSRPTGYIGIKNEGQTGYLNTILQLFYMLRPIREVVEYLASHDEDNLNAKIPVALHRLFSKMERTEETVSARELTHVFGWNDQQLQQAEDPMELLQQLFDRFLSTPFKKAIYETFYSIFYYPKWPKRPAEDELKSQIRTLEAPTLQESCPLVAHEDYRASYLAPVLIYELKRFIYNINADRMEKTHNHFSFPTNLAFNAGLEATDPHTPSAKLHYALHAVLVNRGDFEGAKSYLFFKPQKEGPWIKFRNDHVSFATENEAVDGNFGYVTPPQKLSTSCTAQALVYLRADMLDELLWRP